MRSQLNCLLCGLLVTSMAGLPGLTAAEEDVPQKIALVFVGHGEPVTFAEGDIPITLADGTPFGPHAASLDVPFGAQFTEWAAAYEEIATAMTYVWPDLNGNGIPHEVEISPQGDVPPFFTWKGFRSSLSQHYQWINDHSPHNDTLRAHVDSLEIQVDGAEIDVFLAFLDAVPRIPDVIWEIHEANEHRKLVVVPMLLASSTHTEEVTNMLHESAHMTEGMDIVVCEPLFEVPYARELLQKAVVSMAESVRQTLPADVPDPNIGIVLASHGTPYVPPFPEFGWHEDEIYSNLLLTETLFHDAIVQDLPWSMRTGRMNYAEPSIEDSIAAFDDEGMDHVLVVPSAFPTAAMHTMWDVAEAAMGRAVQPEEGIVIHTHTSGMQVHYTSQGYADNEPGRDLFRAALRFIAKMGVMESLEREANATP